jgi:hypothetical protein
MAKIMKTRTPILALVLFVFTFGQAVADPANVHAVFDDGGENFTVYTTPQSLRMVSITAPTNGTVIVNSTTTVIEADPSAGLKCSITTSVKSDTTPVVDSTHIQWWESAGPDGGVAQLAGTRGFNVLAGETSYYRLVCEHFGRSRASTALAPSLTAIFTPSP